MKLALLGATGVTGPAVLREALARGHDVSVLARNPSAIAAQERLTVHQGNALAAGDLERALAGCEVVLHCLGIGGKGDGKPSTFVSDSVALLLPIMKAQNVRRLVVMSNVGAGGSGPWIARKVIFPVFLRWLIPIIEDKDRMEAILAKTDVEWVAPRFPGIVDGPAKPLRSKGFRITNGSVATFLLDHISDPTYLRATPSVSN